MKPDFVNGLVGLLRRGWFRLRLRVELGEGFADRPRSYKSVNQNASATA